MSRKILFVNSLGLHLRVLWKARFCDLSYPIGIIVLAVFVKRRHIIISLIGGVLSMCVFEMTFEVVCTGEFRLAGWYPAYMDRVLVLFMNGLFMPFLVFLALEALPTASVATGKFVLGDQCIAEQPSASYHRLGSAAHTDMALALIASSMETVNSGSMFWKIQYIDVMVRKLIFGVIDVML